MMAVAAPGRWRAIPLEDAQHWQLCAEEMRAIAEDMQSRECQAMALLIAQDYERLAQLAEARSGHDGAQNANGAT